MTRTACLSLFLIALLTACGTERVLERPVPVEIVRIERVPVPAELLVPIAKQSIPDGITFGEALVKWSHDRATIEALNGRLAAIDSLSEKDEP